ncbi:MAG: hypothetical protein LBQ03_01870, partial [Puniceicoccales bacterium]|nr:hypothetical protein [Puniceicoccales bacterium]
QTISVAATPEKMATRNHSESYVSHKNKSIIIFSNRPYLIISDQPSIDNFPIRLPSTIFQNASK